MKFPHDGADAGSIAHCPAGPSKVPEAQSQDTPKQAGSTSRSAPRLLASGLTGELTQASRNDCDPGNAGAECLAVGALLLVCD